MDTHHCQGRSLPFVVVVGEPTSGHHLDLAHTLSRLVTATFAEVVSAAVCGQLIAVRCDDQETAERVRDSLSGYDHAEVFVTREVPAHAVIFEAVEGANPKTHAA
jgi:hypothetical protein